MHIVVVAFGCVKCTVLVYLVPPHARVGDVYERLKMGKTPQIRGDL